MALFTVFAAVFVLWSIQDKYFAICCFAVHNCINQVFVPNLPLFVLNGVCIFLLKYIIYIKKMLSNIYLCFFIFLHAIMIFIDVYQCFVDHSSLIWITVLQDQVHLCARMLLDIHVYILVSKIIL